MHASQSPVLQTRALTIIAAATVRLPAADVAASGIGSNQPAKEAAHTPAPIEKSTPMLRRRVAGPMTRRTAPKVTVAPSIHSSTVSERARAGAATASRGVSAQCTAHHVAALAVSVEPRVRNDCRASLFNGHQEKRETGQNWR